MSKRVTKPSQDMGEEEDDSSIKAIWDDYATETFIKICVAETMAGNKPSSHFNKRGWTNIVKNFKVETGRPYKCKQLKNKWTSLKKDWQNWTNLIGKETGLRWDPLRQTINADNEWWDNKIKEIPDAAKFPTKGLKNNDQLDILFKDVAVTGEGAWASSQGFMGHDTEIDTNQGEHRTKIVEDNDEQDDIEDSNDGLDDFDISPPTGATSNQEKGRKRKKTIRKVGVGAKVSKQLDAIIEAMVNRSNNYKRNDKPGCSIEEVMDVIDGIPEVFHDNELYMTATDILIDRRNREMFVALKDRNRQINWLRHKKS